jgi:hypothetical protein
MCHRGLMVQAEVSAVEADHITIVLADKFPLQFFYLLL